jgi:glutathione synthase/RimK-type ligase-like ATP-grasp enzyme
LFATEIRSEAIDYRYASHEDQDVEMVPIELPPTIEARCFALAKQLNLPLCGIDLKLTPQGEYYCFEVNPSPGYSYFQENSGQNIAQAIVNYLAFGTARPA